MLKGDYDSWDVPYLPIDPRHLGRSYEAVVRVNSQSGKGGVAYVLLHEYGLDLPRGLQVDFSNTIQQVTEDTGTEITSYEIHRRFMADYVEPANPLVEIVGHRATSDTIDSGLTTLEAKLIVDGEELMVSGEGNGPIDAFVHALSSAGLFKGKIADYTEPHPRSRIRRHSRRLRGHRYRRSESGLGRRPARVNRQRLAAGHHLRRQQFHVLKLIS